MIKMNHTQIVFSVILILVACACITPKEARILKKNTKDWRESPVVFKGYSDSPLAATFLILRENKKFEYTSSGMVQSFEAGTWTNNQDTINLSYVDQTQKVKRTQEFYIDRKTSTLIFEGDTSPVYMRLRVVVNDL